MELELVFGVVLTSTLLSKAWSFELLKLEGDWERSCYGADIPPKVDTWENGQKYCKSKGGTLPRLPSGDSAKMTDAIKAFKEQIEKIPDVDPTTIYSSPISLHIDYRDRSKAGLFKLRAKKQEYLSSDKKNKIKVSSYKKHFAPLEPTKLDPLGVQRCLMLSPALGFKLLDESCGVTPGVIACSLPNERCDSVEANEETADQSNSS